MIHSKFGDVILFTCYNHQNSFFRISYNKQSCRSHGVSHGLTSLSACCVEVLHSLCIASILVITLVNRFRLYLISFATIALRDNSVSAT